MTTMPDPPFQPAVCLRPDLEVIRLSGEDGRDFLNDTLTAQIKTLEDNCARPACLLSPQGRILFDMLIIIKAEAIFIITEQAQAGPLTKRLLMYRLRRKLDIAQDSEFSVAHLWGKGSGDFLLPEKCVSGHDERHATLGRLVLFTKESALPQPSPATDWHAVRIGFGIPEGATDLIPNRALMLEAGLHQLGAVDFDKGCYVGQEVTARTHYRGLVKRRLLPVTSEHPLRSGCAVLRGEATIGQTCSVAALSDGRHICLASLRLDAVQAVLTGEASLTSEDGHLLSLQIPDWMKPLPGFDEE